MLVYTCDFMLVQEYIKGGDDTHTYKEKDKFTKCVPGPRERERVNEGGREKRLERRLQGWNQLGQERLPPPALRGPRGRAPVTR